MFTITMVIRLFRANISTPISFLQTSFEHDWYTCRVGLHDGVVQCGLAFVRRSYRANNGGHYTAGGSGRIHALRKPAAAAAVTRQGTDTG